MGPLLDGEDYISGVVPARLRYEKYHPAHPHVHQTPRSVISGKRWSRRQFYAPAPSIGILMSREQDLFCACFLLGSLVPISTLCIVKNAV
jgi:hypothetical protein